MDLETDDPERNEIREKLSTMTFEEIIKLKEKLGTKVYLEATQGAKKIPKTDFKRENKNRPREVSSKKPAHKKPKIKAKAALEVRDPRFDHLCGEFDDRRFRKDYGFIDKIRENEKKDLIKKLKTEDDPAKRKLIKSSIQRLKNKERDAAKKAAKEEKILAEREERKSLIKQGKKPHFKSKLESKVEGLVEQYTQFKNKSQLQKHIERQRKRRSQKDKKRGFFDEA